MNITTEQLEEIFAKIIKEVKSSNFSNLSRDEKIKLAKDPNTSPKTLEFLASDENSYVRYWVANNPNTSPETLELLATDEEWDVRWRVAKNPNTPPKTLELLATDEDYGVRYYVARNPNTLPETLELLATDKNSHVRYGVAINPNYQKSITLSLTTKEFNTLKQTLSSLNSDEISSILKKL